MSPVTGQCVGIDISEDLTECMRKLLVMKNTLVARGQHWDPTYAL